MIVVGLKRQNAVGRSRGLSLEVLRLVARKLHPGLGLRKLLGDGAVEIRVAGADELQGRDDLAMEPRGVGGSVVLETAGDDGFELARPELGCGRVVGHAAEGFELGPGVAGRAVVPRSLAV